MSWLDKSVNENKGVEFIESNDIIFRLDFEAYKVQRDWFEERERGLSNYIQSGEYHRDLVEVK